MSLINALTEEQQVRMAEFRDRWIAIGLSTEPASRDNAEAAIRKIYVCAEIPPPRKIIWCGSPLSQGLTRAIILDRKIGASVGASVWASVGASVGASVWDSVRASVGASVWASVWASVGDSGYGQHDAHWLGFLEYFRAVCQLQKQTEKATGLIEQATHAGWYLPHQNICWVSERHHILQRDERGRLHCEAGPAVAFPDGWAIYSWHGVRVPEAIIERPQEITEDAIFGERNAEIRRVMIERYGKERLLGSQRLKQVDVDAANLAELYRVDLGDGIEWGLLSLTCHSTGKTTVIWTRPEYRSAREALARSYGLQRAEDYRPAIQT